MIWKMSPSVKLEILGVFVNILTVDHKYPVWDIENLAFPIKALLSKKLFPGFLVHVWNFEQIWNIFKKKKFVIANILPKLQNAKDFLRPLSKKRRFQIFFWRSTS